ncbi:MAG: thioesterase domain-containing protein, partial [Methylococcales bacterium]
VQISPVLADWPSWAKKYRNRKLPLRFSEIIDEKDLRIDEGQGGNIREQIDQSDPVQCEEIITRYMRDRIAAVLRISPDRLELDQPLNELGLDSLMMVELGIRVENDLSISLPTGQLMQTPSLQGLTQVILKVLGKDGGKDGGKTVAARDTESAAPKFPGCLLPLNTTGLEYNLFCFHPLGGLVNDFNPLAEHLEGRVSVFGLQSCLLAGADKEFGSIEEMAAEYVRSILEQQPAGSYYFLGFSFGGLVALEAARMLTAQGRPVALLGMLDTIVGFDDEIAKIKTQFIQELSHLFLSEFNLFGIQDEQEKQQYIDEIQAIVQIESEQSYEQAVMDWIKRKDFPIEAIQLQIISIYLALFSSHFKLLENYRVEPITDVAIDYWHASEGVYENRPHNPVLLELSNIKVRQHRLIGRHYQVLQRPGVSFLAEEIAGMVMKTKPEISSYQLKEKEAHAES